MTPVSRSNPTSENIHSPFGKAWRGYVRNTLFAALPSHDQALVRVAFASGWRAAIDSLEDGIGDGLVMNGASKD